MNALVGLHGVEILAILSGIIALAFLAVSPNVESKRRFNARKGGGHTDAAAFTRSRFAPFHESVTTQEGPHNHG